MKKLQQIEMKIKKTSKKYKNTKKIKKLYKYVHAQSIKSCNRICKSKMDNGREQQLLKKRVS